MRYAHWNVHVAIRIILYVPLTSSSYIGSMLVAPYPYVESTGIMRGFGMCNNYFCVGGQTDSRLRDCTRRVCTWNSLR